VLNKWQTDDDRAALYTSERTTDLFPPIPDDGTPCPGKLVFGHAEYPSRRIQPDVLKGPNRSL